MQLSRSLTRWVGMSRLGKVDYRQFRDLEKFLSLFFVFANTIHNGKRWDNFLESFLRCIYIRMHALFVEIYVVPEHAHAHAHAASKAGLCSIKSTVVGIDTRIAFMILSIHLCLQVACKIVS